MARLPEGTITFMLTDLRGSTHAWERQPKAMRRAMARHDAILAGTVLDHAGEQVEAGREGDSILAVFRTATTAAACAVEIQKKFADESWPEGLELKVRIALNTGEAQLRAGHYFGAALNRCARLLASCHPGQILLTKATEAMLADEIPQGTALQDLGMHRLKDLIRSEHVFQLNDLARPIDFPPIQSMPQKLTNMPKYLTTFVGRNAELSALRSLLPRSRMVTLTGAGGSGKTRLAAELGKLCLRLSPGGVWWVDLAPVNQDDQVSEAVLASLELPGQGPAPEVVTAWLAARRAVLVLDNCEQVVAGCADFCQTAFQRCQELTIIATSREALGVSGEAHWPVSSMGAADAVQLFEARARLVAPDFRVTPSNLDTVTQICEHLDGMPLAIELAAARLGMMTEKDLLTQLSDRFRVLTGGSRSAPGRQKTLIATIDWSYRLLTNDEAMLFRRLAVFKGGFNVESARAVCVDGIGGSMLDVLTGLVQKSMVVAERLDDGSTRFRLLESHRVYALDRLLEAGELELTSKHHYEYFMEAMAARTISWTGPKASELAPGIAERNWKAREAANLWRAVGWARDNTDDMGLGLALLVADFDFTDQARAHALLLDLLARSPAKGAVRAAALNLAARLAARQADATNSRRLADTSVAVAREVGDTELIAHTLSGAGVVYAAAGELGVAGQMYDEAISLLKGSSSRRLSIEVQNHLGVLMTEQGNYREALQILGDCVEFGRSEHDEPSTARFLESLANALLGLGDLESAAATWKESLSIHHELNDPFGTIWCVGGLALVAAARGDDQRALRLSAVVDRMSREWSLSAWPARVKQLEEAARTARSRLGAAKSARVWDSGQVMNTARALVYALE